MPFPPAGPGPVNKLEPARLDALRQDAVTVLPGAAAHPLVMVCEHAGALVPAPWRDLGLDKALLATHFAFDLGAGAMTRALCTDLGAPGVLARYSRLFLDYNRYPQDWEQMRPDMGGIPVPGNLAPDDAERALRNQIAAAPLAAAIDTAALGRQGMVAVHSFTSVMNGHTRALDIGVLGRRDCRFLRALVDALQRTAGGLRVAENAPYDWHQVDAFCLQHHAEARALPCVALEFNNAALADPGTFSAIRALVGTALTEVVQNLGFRSHPAEGLGTSAGRAD